MKSAGRMERISPRIPSDMIPAIMCAMCAMSVSSLVPVLDLARLSHAKRQPVKRLYQDFTKRSDLP